MHIGGSVAIVSEDETFSDAICTLFRLEQVSCEALKLHDALTYAATRSTACVLIHVKHLGDVPSVLAACPEFAGRVIVLSEQLGDDATENLRGQGVADVLTVPVNSRRLLSAVYSMLRQPQSCRI